MKPALRARLAWSGTGPIRPTRVAHDPAPGVRRRTAGPAPEGAIEGADFRVPQKTGDLAERVLALSQVVERETPTRVVDQPLEVDALLPQASLQRALAHRDLPRNQREARVAVAQRLPDRPSDRGEQVVLAWHLHEDPVEISLQDRVEMFVGGRHLAVSELARDDERIRRATERDRRPEHPGVLRHIGRGGMSELDLDRGPLASGHEPDRVP